MINFSRFSNAFVKSLQAMSFIFYSSVPQVGFAKSEFKSLGLESRFVNEFILAYGKAKNIESLLKPFVKYESANNKKAVLEFITQNKNQKLPKISSEKNSIRFSADDIAYTVEVVNLIENRYKVNGYEFVYDMTKPFAERLKLFDRMVRYKKNVSVWQFLLVNEAHAGGFFVVLGLLGVTAAGIALWMNSEQKSLIEGEIAVADSRRILYGFQLGLVCKDSAKDSTQHKLLVLTPDADNKLAYDEYDKTAMYAKFKNDKVNLQTSHYQEINLNSEKELKDYLGQIKSKYDLRVQFEDEKQPDYLDAKRLVEHLNRCCNEAKVVNCERRYNTQFFGDKVYDSPETAETSYLRAIDAPDKGLLSKYIRAANPAHSSTNVISSDETSGASGR